MIQRNKYFQSSRFLLLLFVICILTLFVSPAPSDARIIYELDEQPVPYIVQGQDMDSVVTAVEEVGGIITHELGVINAVGAQLTTSQKEALAEQFHIYADTSLSVESSDEMVRDEFNSTSYSNNDGSVNWSSDWFETGDDNNPWSGDITIEVDYDCRGFGSQCIEFDSDAGEGAAITRQVDLGTATAAYLTFDYHLDDRDPTYKLEVSADGGSNWTTLKNYSRRRWKFGETFDLSPFMAANTQIRFRLIEGDYHAHMYIDNIQIAYTDNGNPPSSSPPPDPATGDSETVRDEFNMPWYSNNDGSKNWNSDWVETSDYYGPFGGDITIEYDYSCPNFGMQCIEFDGDAGENASVTRQVDLSEAVLATLTFDYKKDNYYHTYYLEVSADGGSTWTTLQQYHAATTNTGETFDLSPYISANTQIRYRLQNSGGFGHFYIDNVQIEYWAVPDTHYPTLTGAKQLHDQGITGSGTTVAVLDTGHYSHPSLNRGSDNNWRVLGQYDAILDQMVYGNGDQPADTDDNGHGAHVTSIILNSKRGSGGQFTGIAPGANLVSVKAFNEDGVGGYLDVIRGIDWIVTNKDLYNIRVLNLSFSAPPESYYWEDPLNQAVMAAWQSGIVVVAAAGNTGPDPMTIGVPGNVPYIITVGALSDNYTPDDTNDDLLTSFSSTGPTVEGFVKPNVVAPGGHLLGKMSPLSKLANMYPEYNEVGDYYSFSGTSQATAVTSGIVALMLQSNPNLTPDDVKCRLMASARVAVNPDGTAAYSVFQQGAGVVNAYDAVYSTASGCANQGVDIAADLNGTQHFQGMADQDPNGDFYLPNLTGDGFAWSGGFAWSEGFAWSGGFVWSGGFAWSDGFAWSGGFVWSDNYVWDAGFVWSGANTSVNQWISHE